MPFFLPSTPAAYSIGAVFLWGASDFAGGYGVRRANAFVFTAFSHLCAFSLMLLISLSEHVPLPSRASIFWSVLAGILGGVALALFYRALASGQMGLAAPTAALIGAAIPTLADIALEGAPSRWSIAGFILAVLAIWLITRPEPQGNNDETGHPKGVAMAALAGVGFAAFYICMHQTTGSPIFVAAIGRIASFVATAVVVIATGAPLAMELPSIGIAMLAGFLDISGSALYIYASQRGRLDEAVVITSLYPAITVLLARIILKEHFSRWKFVGLLAALAAVPMIAAG
ncbi:MAG: DMT family transporter [Candidatus Sulfotelmatobacter sp.]